MSAGKRRAFCVSAYAHDGRERSTVVQRTGREVVSEYGRRSDGAHCGYDMECPIECPVFLQRRQGQNGCGAALLLRKPGADDERIIDDYLKSAENLREELARAAAENPDIDLGVITPDRSYMEEFLRSVSF